MEKAQGKTNQAAAEDKDLGVSEQLPQLRRRPVHDNQLPGNLCFALTLVGRRVANINALKVEAIESTANIWVIVDAHHHLTFASAHEFRHALILVERKVDSVASGLPVRRIHVEKSVISIVTLGAIEPRPVSYTHLTLPTTPYV